MLHRDGRTIYLKSKAEANYKVKKLEILTRFGKLVHNLQVTVWVHVVVRLNSRPSCKGISWKLEKVDSKECGVPTYASSPAFLCFCTRVKGMGVRVIKN